MSLKSFFVWSLAVATLKARTNVAKLLKRYDSAADEKAVALDRDEFVNMLNDFGYGNLVSAVCSHYIIEDYEEVGVTQISDQVMPLVNHGAMKTLVAEIRKAELKSSGLDTTGWKFGGENVDRVRNELKDMLVKYGLSLSEIFKHIDADQSGTITQSEFIQGFEKMGFTGLPVLPFVIFDSLDEDRSGRAEYGELDAWIEGKKLIQPMGNHFPEPMQGDKFNSDNFGDETFTMKRSADDATAGGEATAKKFVLERGSEPALEMLEALGVSRATAMEALAESASAKIVSQVPLMPPKRRMQLLAASFPHVDSPRLRNVAIAALQHAPELPADIAAALIGPQQQLLSELPLSVRQRVWEIEFPPTLFLKETHSLVMATQSQLALSFARAALREAAEVPPKLRRAECATLQSLVELVGSQPLYAALAKLCVEIYDGGGGDATAGALRCDLIMALHEADDAARPIVRWEPYHTFCCCIDAALREQKLEARAIALLLNHALAAGLPPLSGEPAEGVPAPPPMFLEWLEEEDGEEEEDDEAGGSSGASSARPTGATLSELAMLLSPPPCTLLLTETLMARLEAVVDAQTLPASDPQARGLVQLFHLASRAPSLLRASLSGERAAWAKCLIKMPPVLEQVVHRSLPMVAELLVRDQIRAAKRRDEPPPPPPPEVLERLMAPGLPRHLVLLYVVKRVEAADEARVEQMLPLVMASLTSAELAAHPEWAGGLVGALVNDPAKRLTRRIATCVIHRCLVPLSRASGHAHSQLLRLLIAQWQALHAMPAAGVADTVDGILASKGVESGSVVASAATGHDGALTLLQFAARAGKADGAVEAGAEGEVKRSYEKLEALVPGVV